jgi:hypothetical protein
MKLLPLIKENFEYDATEDFVHRRDVQLEEVAKFILEKSQGKIRLPWITIPATLLTRVWYQFGKNPQREVNTNDLDKIADRILTNIARLRVTTEMMEHTSYDVRPELEDLGFTFTDEQWEEWVPNVLKNKKGSFLISDYGLPKLENIYPSIFNAKTNEEKIYACDKALNIIHQRSDLAAMFIEGGSSTLTKIQVQGGYSSDDNNYD